MKKIIGLVTCCLVLSVFLIGADNGADVVKSEGCLFFDANGVAHFVPDARIQTVFTNNKKGTANTTCTGQLPEGAALPDRAIKFDFAATGLTCLGGENWKMTVSPNGQASFICHGG